MRTQNHNNEEKVQLKKLCQKTSRIFFNDGNTLSFTNLIKHGVRTTDEILIHTKPFSYNQKEHQEIRKQIDNQPEQKIINIVIINSSPKFLVSKQNGSRK